MKAEQTEAQKILQKYLNASIERLLKIKDFISINKVLDIVEDVYSEGQLNPKIKALKWEYFGTYYSTENDIFKYSITHANNFNSERGLYSLFINNEFISYYAEFDEAKSKGQEDFEERIKKCLITE